MTKAEIIGWRRLPYGKTMHHFKRRPSMETAVSACWMVAQYRSLKVDNGLPRCGLCEIMVAYHNGEDWYKGDS